VQSRREAQHRKNRKLEMARIEFVTCFLLLMVTDLATFSKFLSYRFTPVFSCFHQNLNSSFRQLQCTQAFLFLPVYAVGYFLQRLAPSMIHWQAVTCFFLF